MAELQFFKPDLALELGTKATREWEANNHTTESEGVLVSGKQSLGHAFLVLLQASRSALRKAIADFEGESVLSASLRTLVSYVEEVESGTQGELSSSRMQDVYRPLLDKILKKSDDSQKKITFLLLDWLILEYPHRALMVQALSEDLAQGNDKKRKLAVLLAIEHALHTWDRLRSSTKSSNPKSTLIITEPTIQSTGADFVSRSDALLDAQTLFQWISQLSIVVRSDAAVNANGSRSMTRLTGLGVDLSVKISKVLAELSVQEIQDADAACKASLVSEIVSPEREMPLKLDTYSWSFAQSMLSIQRILTEYQSWELPRNAMFSAGLKDTLDLISQFNSSHTGNGGLPSHEVLRSFAQNWKIISSVFGQKDAALTLADEVPKYIEMPSIPPYLGLLTSSILCGYYIPPTLSGQIPQVFEQVKARLLLLSNTVIAENMSVGKNVALFLQEILGPTLCEKDLASMKPQLLSFLDIPTDITPGCADMLARYTMFYPEILIPELLDRIQQYDQGCSRAPRNLVHTSITSNAIRVVEALFTRDFFITIVPSSVEGHRNSLEHAMIQLLQDNELKTEIIIDQLVASIDPQKIIHEYGPRLVAAESKVCSMAESILIKCMLSQEQDGSLGEGFASFIEYIRCTSRIGSFPKRVVNKARSPEQLLAMAKETSGRLVVQDENDSSNSKEALLDSLFHVIAKLGEAISHSLWANFISYLALKTYGCPTDPLMIRVWNSFAPSLASSPEAIASLSTTILDIMDGQGVLTEDMLDSALEASDEALDDLRLARLSPLLILKTVSSRGFANAYKSIAASHSQIDSIPERMLTSLQSRSDNRLEFSLVKALAKTICHDLFPDSSLEAIYRGMAAQFSRKPFHVEEIDFVDARSWLFALYDWIRNWSGQSTSQGKNGDDIAWIYRIVSDFLYEITATTTTTIEYAQDLYKLQLGVVDILSKILLATAPFYSGLQQSTIMGHGAASYPLESARSTGDPVTDRPSADHNDVDLSLLPNTPQDLFLCLIRDLSRTIVRPLHERNETDMATAACVINVFIMAMQSLASSATSTTPNSSSGPIRSKRISCALMDLTTPGLAAAVTSFLRDEDIANAKGYSLLIQGCIQILYTGASVAATVEGCATSERTRQEAMDVVVLGIRSREAGIATASLKLFAAMSSARMISPELLTKNNLLALQEGLGRLHGSENSILVEKMQEWLI